MRRPDIQAKMIMTPEVRLKISKTLQGHVISEETRQKIRETLQARPKKQRPIATCCHCYVTFLVKKGEQQFCSSACYQGSRC